MKVKVGRKRRKISSEREMDEVEKMFPHFFGAACALVVLTQCSFVFEEECEIFLSLDLGHLTLWADPKEIQRGQVAPESVTLYHAGLI